MKDKGTESPEDGAGIMDQACGHPGGPSGVY